MKERKRAGSNGFTLIELIVVIVILGILAATAMPKFVDFSGNAHQAAAEAVAAGISSGISTNYATCKINPSAADCVPRAALDLSSVCTPVMLNNFLAGTSKSVTLKTGTGGAGDSSTFYLNPVSASCAPLSGQAVCELYAAGKTGGSAAALLTVDCKLFNYK